MENIEFEMDGILPYSVGALLYSPANSEKIAEDIINESFAQPYSLALCLEDAISDLAVEQAEKVMLNTMQKVYKASKYKTVYIPKIFVRVRRPEQIMDLYRRMGNSREILTGFVIPKFAKGNADAYMEEILKANEGSNNTVYVMPILESGDIIDISQRVENLKAVKEILDKNKKYVLNVRVGGNDFCKNFGIRRHIDETIYDIGCIANILSDIITCFSMDYVVSGPVWEYFGRFGGQWKEGLLRELRLDRLNGFIGKTVIHPSQIDVVNAAMRVTEEDYNDAVSIIKLADNDRVLVEKNTTGQRMNEYKTHIVWAEKILALSKVYGVREECEKKIISL